MARQNKDVFGFDELEKSFKRFEKNYPDKADALLMAQGQAVNRKTKSLTPVKTKKLRNSWRLKKSNCTRVEQSELSEFKREHLTGILLNMDMKYIVVAKHE